VTDSITEPTPLYLVVLPPSLAVIVDAILQVHQPLEWWTPARTRQVCTAHDHKVKYPCDARLWAEQQFAQLTTDSGEKEKK